MRTVILAVAAALLVSLTAHRASADVVGTAKVKGKTYYVDVQKSGTSAGVWFRLRPNACSPQDILVATISAAAVSTSPRLTLMQVARGICSIKGIYDGGKTVLGCGSTALTGVCILGSVPTGGAAAVVCSASIVYTAEKGFTDCLDGLRDNIVGSLMGDRNWSALMTGVKIGTGQWGQALDRAIDLACSNLR